MRFAFGSTGLQSFSAMSRGPAHFRQGDLARALRAAKAAGFDRVEFDPVSGRYFFVSGSEQAETERRNFFDEMLKNGNDGNSEPSPV